MSDLNLEKMKVLYADIVTVEVNVIAIEKRMLGHLAILERRAVQSPSRLTKSKNQRFATWSKTALMGVSTAFGGALSVLFIRSPGVAYLAGMPVGMAAAWYFFSYVEKHDLHTKFAAAEGYGWEQILVFLRRSLGINDPWTADEFIAISRSIRWIHPDKTTRACREVLINGVSIAVAADEFGISKTFLAASVAQLEKIRKEEAAKLSVGVGPQG